jgi:hypothetical protein
MLPPGMSPLAAVRRINDLADLGRSVGELHPVEIGDIEAGSARARCHSSRPSNSPSPSMMTGGLVADRVGLDRRQRLDQLVQRPEAECGFPVPVLRATGDVYDPPPA